MHGKEWFRVLKHGATLEVIVPNLVREWLVEIDDESDAYELVVKSLYGGQRDRWDYHKNAFNWRYLRESLEKAGFINIRRDVSSYPYSLDKPYDLRAFTFKGYQPKTFSNSSNLHFLSKCWGCM